MDSTKTVEDERRKMIKESAEALAVFIEHPELLKDDLLEAYVELMKERVEKERSEKQKQLSRL
jgi:mevalonate kinase